MTMPSRRTWDINTLHSISPLAHWPRDTAMMPSATHQLGNKGFAATRNPGTSRARNNVASSSLPPADVAAARIPQITPAAASTATTTRSFFPRGSQRAPSRHTRLPIPLKNSTSGIEKNRVTSEKKTDSFSCHA